MQQNMYEETGFFVGNRKVTGKVFLVTLVAAVGFSAIGHTLLDSLEDHFVGFIYGLVSR